MRRRGHALPVLLLLAAPLRLASLLVAPPSRGNTSSRARHESRCPGIQPRDAQRRSIFCFMVVRPVDYEVNLLRLHLAHGLLSACDAFGVYSNVTLGALVGRAASGALNFGATEPAVRGDMDARHEMRFNKYLGQMMLTGPLVGPVHAKFVWPAVVRDTRSRSFHWYVKIDPDVVFFPDRLRYILERHPDPENRPVAIGTHVDCTVLHGQVSVYSRRALELLAGEHGGCGWDPEIVETNGESGLAHLCMKSHAEIWPEPGIIGDHGCCDDSCSWAASRHPFKEPVGFWQCLQRSEGGRGTQCYGQPMRERCAD